MRTTLLLLLLSLVLSVQALSVEVAQGQQIVISIVYSSITTGPNASSGGSIVKYDNTHTTYTAGTTFEGQDQLVGTDGQGNAVTATITVYQPCSKTNVYMTPSGSYNDVPTPVVSIVDNTFTASVAYFREDFNYRLDFVSSQDSNYASSVGPNYSSAPTATYPSALLNSVYGAYDTGSLWALSSLNCSQVQYTITVPFSDLTQCKSPTSGYCVTITSVAGTPFVDYTGQLVISAYQDANVVRTWSYPFTYRFNTYTTVVTGGTSVDKLVSFSVSSTLTSSSNLQIAVTSTTTSGSQYLDSPVYDSSLSLTTTPTSQQTQVWTFQSTSVASSYIGQYTFSWNVLPDSSRSLKATTVQITVSISMSSQPVVSQSYSLNTAVSTYTDSAFTSSSSGPFSTTSPIYIASVYSGSASYTPAINNAWICYPSVSDVVPTYDPSNGLYGCSVPTAAIPAANIFTLMTDGVVNTDASYTVASFPTLTISSNPASGLSFQFTSSNTPDRVYYIHVETKLNPNARSRRFGRHLLANDTTTLAQTASAVNAFFVFKQDQLAQLSSQATTTTILLVVFLVGFVPIPIIAIIGFFVVYKIIRRKRRNTELTKQIGRRAVFFKVTGGEIRCIDDVLCDKDLLIKYGEFCEKEHRAESLMFYLAAQNYEGMDKGTEKDEEFKRIYSKYIQKGSEWELNIPDAMRENAAAELTTIMGLIKVEMAQDTFKRFCVNLNNELNGVLSRPVAVSPPSTPVLYKTISFKLPPPALDSTDTASSTSTELVDITVGTPMQVQTEEITVEVTPIEV